MLGDGEVQQLEERSHKQIQFVAKIGQSKVFEPGLGLLTGYEACLDPTIESKPRFCKARPVPFALKKKVAEALHKSEAEGILVKVDYSEYASPAVPVLKEDQTVSICGDYKSTLNPSLDIKVYPLPAVEDFFAEMMGGDLFSKIDIKQAYNNLPLRPDDQFLTTLNTHQGLYKWTRLPYGVSSSSAIFQSAMD